MRLQAVGNALQLLPVLGFNMRPQNLAGGGAEKFPVAIGVVRVLQLDGLEGVGDLGRQQVSVLKSDLGGRAFQVDIGPSTAREAPGLLQAPIGGAASQVAYSMR